MTLHRQEKKISERFHFFREKKTLPAKGLCFGRFSVLQHCSREMTNVSNLSKRFYLVWPQLWNIYINPGSCSFVCFSRTQFLHFYSNLAIAIDLIGRFPKWLSTFELCTISNDCMTDEQLKISPPLGPKGSYPPWLSSTWDGDGWGGRNGISLAFY